MNIFFHFILMLLMIGSWFSFKSEVCKLASILEFCYILEEIFSLSSYHWLDDVSVRPSGILLAAANIFIKTLIGIHLL